MSNAFIDSAIALMKQQRFGEALPLLQREIDANPSASNALYMAGQCCRFTNDLGGAINYLGRAIALDPNDPPKWLALGIALQVAERFDEALNTFRQGIELDPDYDLLYNSLAMTQKRIGQNDKAIHNYDGGVKALVRRIVKGMPNDRTSPLIRYHYVPQNLWAEHAMYGALFLCSSDNRIKHVAWPTGEQAAEEERTHRHEGLYWIDGPNAQLELVRLFLPNYFNTFQFKLRADGTYANLVGNRGTVLQAAGREDEARQHFSEAQEFLPAG